MIWDRDGTAPPYPAIQAPRKSGADLKAVATWFKAMEMYNGLVATLRHMVLTIDTPGHRCETPKKTMVETYIRISGI